MNAKTFILGIGAGLVAGAAVTLFTTPKSGQELKGSLSNYKNNSAEIKNELQQRIATIKQSVNSIKYEVQNTLPDAVSGIKEAVSTFQESSAPAQQNLQTHIADLKKSADELAAEIDELQNIRTKKKQ